MHPEAIYGTGGNSHVGAAAITLDQLAPRTGTGDRASVGSSFQYENRDRADGSGALQLQMLGEQLGEVLVLLSHWACREHMQAHTSLTVPRHRPPEARPWPRSILTLGCQVTEKLVFDLTQREGRPCFF